MMLTAKLIDSVAAGHLSEAAKYLQEGAEPNKLSSEGATAMHIAAGVGVEAVRLMLRYGGDPNIRSVDGSTPLHVAAAWGDKETLRLLLHNGANPDTFDQDGQRAVDVAKSEDHAACVDFLRYYTMLVSVGDKEEDAMYTAELVDPSHGEPTVHPLSSPQPVLQGLPDDPDDDPANLSLEYSEALSRRLSRLLQDGKTACLDVTSPDCPYIRNRARRKSEIHIHDRGGGVLLDDSDSGDDDRVCAPKGRVSGCRCRVCLPQGCASPCQCGGDCSHSCCLFHTDMSPALRKSDAGYAEQLERRMKQKYFPRLSGGGCMADRSGLSTCGIQQTGCVCKHKYFKPLLSGQDLCHSDSPCSCFSVHSRHSPQRLTPTSTHCTDVCSGQHSPCSASRCCHHQSPCSRRSPCRHEAHYDPFSQVCHGEASTSGHSKCGLYGSSPPRVHLSPLGQRRQHNVPSSPKALLSERSHSVSPTLRKQATYPPTAKPQATCQPSAKPSCTPPRQRSPVTIMSVLGGPGARTPPPGIFRRYGIPSPLGKHCPTARELMETHSHDVQQVPSALSVDSGFGEQIRKYPVDSVSKAVQALSDQAANKHAISISKQTEAENSRQTYSQFKSDGCSILSSNLKLNEDQIASTGIPQKKRDPVTSSSKFSFGKTDSEASTGPVCRSANYHANKKDQQLNHSVSSSESFRTCEEGSEQSSGMDSDATVLEGTGPQLVSKTPSPRKSRKDSATASFYPDTERALREKPNKCKRESLGFSLSQFDSDASGDSPIMFEKQHAISQNEVSLKSKTDAGTPIIGKQEAVNGEFPVSHSSNPSSQKRWAPPSGPPLDDSDLFTSDGSFAIKPDELEVETKGRSNPALSSVTNVSKWLENLAVTAQGNQLGVGEGNINKACKVPKRMSDESAVSTASSIQEYVYRDKENGITLIERHIPSDYSGSSGRPSLESAHTCHSDDTEETQSYDWSNFVIDNQTSSSSGSSFDITAGQTLNSEEISNSQETLMDVAVNDKCDSQCLDEGCKEDTTEMSDTDSLDDSDEDWLESAKFKVSKKKRDAAATKRSKTKPQSNSVQMKQPANKTENNLPSNSNSSCKQDRNLSSLADLPSSDDDETIPPELAGLTNEAIFQSLKDLGEDPGPVLPSTRQTYLQRLASLQSGKTRLALSTSQPGYSSELNRLLSGSLDMEDLSNTELQMVAQFQTPDGRTWREGTIKSCFNYLLLDPRLTKNLPFRSKTLSKTEAFKTFLSAIFYIGKGKRSRPYCHLYEAISQLKSPKAKVSTKVQKILDIWANGVGVVSLHCFQNVIPVEAYTREACMVDAIGLGRLTNMKRGDYYGVASTWPGTRRRCMGAYLLHKAFHIFLSEGERQICPPDIQRGK